MGGGGGSSLLVGEQGGVWIAAEHTLGSGVRDRLALQTLVILSALQQSGHVLFPLTHVSSVLGCIGPADTVACLMLVRECTDLVVRKPGVDPRTGLPLGLRKVADKFMAVLRKNVGAHPTVAAVFCHCHTQPRSAAAR
jgi:hypothetical protein